MYFKIKNGGLTYFLINCLDDGPLAYLGTL